MTFTQDQISGFISSGCSPRALEQAANRGGEALVVLQEHCGMTRPQVRALMTRWGISIREK